MSETAGGEVGDPVVGRAGMEGIRAGDRIRATWEAASGDSVVRAAKVAATDHRDDTSAVLLAPDGWKAPKTRLSMDRDGVVTVEKLADPNRDAWVKVNVGPVTLHRFGGEMNGGERQ